MKKEVICGIYKITSPTGKLYIGISPDIYKRWSRYRYEKAKRQPKLNASFMKYGVDAHSFEIIEICDENILDELETYFIAFFNSFNTNNGMNLTLGGRGTKGCRISEKQKKLISKNNSGRVVTEETKKKTSDTLKKMYASGYPHPSTGKKQLKEHIAKRVAKNTGLKHNEETKKQMSIAAMGNNKWVGRKHSEESKLKISKSIKGKSRKRNSNIILNLETGIYYDGVKEAANSINISMSYLSRKLIGIKRNNTSLIYA